MAINSYTTLKSAISNWLARDDLAPYLEDFISMGESRIYRDLRIRCMETALSSTISAGVIAVPSSYKEMKFAYINSSPVEKLTRKNSEWIYQNYPTRSASGHPHFFAREGANFIFGPYPDSEYTVNGIYYASLTDLSADNETNWVTENAPDLLLFASLCEAEPFMQNDARISLWEDKYRTTAKKIQSEDDVEDLSGSILMTSVG